MLLHIEDLSFGYGQNLILQNASLSLDAGEAVAILGSNGVGKSTLLKLILGLIQPQQAGGTRININGVNVLENTMSARQYMAYLPEQTALYPYLTGYENLRYFLGLSAKPLPPRAVLCRCLQDAGLQESAWHQRTDTYSKGMRQKVMIAIAQARQAKLLLLDEPSSGLDPLAVADLHQSLLRAKSNGMAILMVTHDILALDEIANCGYILRDKQLTQLAQDALLTGASSLRNIYGNQPHAA